MEKEIIGRNSGRSKMVGSCGGEGGGLMRDLLNYSLFIIASDLGLALGGGMLSPKQ